VSPVRNLADRRGTGRTAGAGQSRAGQRGRGQTAMNRNLLQQDMDKAA